MAGELDALYTFLVVVSAVVTLLIFFFVFFFAVKYRRRSAGRSDAQAQSTAPSLWRSPGA